MKESISVKQWVLYLLRTITKSILSMMLTPIRNNWNSNTMCAYIQGGDYLTIMRLLNQWTLSCTNNHFYTLSQQKKTISRIEFFLKFSIMTSCVASLGVLSLLDFWERSQVRMYSVSALQTEVSSAFIM